MHRIACAAVCMMVACAAALPSAARADGVMHVQQHDGTLQTYDHVRIRMVGQTLWIHSGDRKGVLEVVSGACSFVREMQRCLPYATSLHQHGNTHQIALQHGTVYLNLTGELRHLPRSTQGVPPNGVLLLLRTMHGTYVSVRGTLDEVKS